MQKPLRKKKRDIGGIVLTVLFSLVCILYVMPIVEVLINSFKTHSAINTDTFALPNAGTFAGTSNYVKGMTFGNYPFLKSLLYSIVITILSVTLILLCTSMAAWFISRVGGRFSRLFYLGCVFSMIVPFQMVMFPLVSVANDLYLNTPWTIPVIYLGFGAGLAVFMFSGFVKSLPLEIEEAAVIDGCGPIRTFFSVVLPMLRPTLISVGILEVMWVWNDYLLPSLVLDINEYKTIPIHVQYLQGSYGTIKDLARLSGYSVGTVSRALNGLPNVSEQARSAILALAQERGYQLNTNAKYLKQIHSSGIVAVVTGTSNELFAQMIERIQQTLPTDRYPLTVDYVDENEDPVERALHLSREKKPAGLLFLGGDRRMYAKSFGEITLPSVVLTTDAARLGFDNLSSVTTDDVEAAECAMEYLLESGHRRIGVIAGDLSCSGPSRLRYEGCLLALERCGLTLPDECCATARYAFQDGYDAALRLLEQPGLTAIFAMSDVMAIGAMRALHDRGLRIPEDISVIGFDGLELGEFYTPKLTTIRQQASLLVDRGVALLLGTLERGAVARHETVPFTLAVRESTSHPPRKDGTNS